MSTQDGLPDFPGIESRPMFARSVVGGKRSAKCEARITDETKFDLQRKCHEIGVSESDYIDRLVCLSLYGFEHVESIERERTRAVCGLSGFMQRSA